MPASYIDRPNALSRGADRLLAIGELMGRSKEAKGVELARKREEDLRRHDQFTEFTVEHGGGVGATPTTTEMIPGTGRPIPPPDLGRDIFQPKEVGGIGIRAGQDKGMGIAPPPIPRQIDSSTINGPLSVTKADPRYQSIDAGDGLKGFVRTPDSLEADKELGKANVAWDQRKKFGSAVAGMRPDLDPSTQGAMVDALDSGAIGNIPAIQKADPERGIEDRYTAGGKVYHRLIDPTNGRTIKELGESPGDAPGASGGRITYTEALRQLEGAYKTTDPLTGDVRWTGGMTPEKADKIATMRAKEGISLEEANQRMATPPTAGGGMGAVHAVGDVNRVLPPPVLPVPGAARLPAGGFGATAKPAASGFPAPPPSAAPMKQRITAEEADSLRAQGYTDEEITSRYSIR